MPAQAQLSLAETDPAPITYTVPAAQIIGLLCANANFDGSGSATAYLPALEIVSDSGHIVSRTIGQEVAIGGSAEVTFAPFLSSAAAAAGGGIEFNTDPQHGGFLRTQTTGDTTLKAFESGGFANATLTLAEEWSIIASPLGVGVGVEASIHANKIGGKAQLVIAAGAPAPTVPNPTSGIVILASEDFIRVRKASSSVGCGLELPSQTDPGNAPGNNVRLFCRTTGGKQQLAAIFDTGAIIPIVTEV